MLFLTLPWEHNDGVESVTWTTGLFQADSRIEKLVESGCGQVILANDADYSFLLGEHCLQIHSFKLCIRDPSIGNYERDVTRNYRRRAASTRRCPTPWASGSLWCSHLTWWHWNWTRITLSLALHAAAMGWDALYIVQFWFSRWSSFYSRWCIVNCRSGSCWQKWSHIQVFT